MRSRIELAVENDSGQHESPAYASVCECQFGTGSTANKVDLDLPAIFFACLANKRLRVGDANRLRFLRKPNVPD